MNEQTDNQINKPRPQTSKHTNTQTRKHTNTPTAKLTGRIGSPSQIHFIIMEAFQNILYDHLCFYRPLYHHLSPIYPHMGIADMRMEKGQERNLALNIHTVAVTVVTPMRCCPGAQKLDCFYRPKYQLCPYIWWLERMGSSVLPLISVETPTSSAAPRRVGTR